jgi:hypothetical protein
MEIILFLLLSIILVFLFLPLSCAKFKELFFIYLFLFVPFYYFIFDLYLKAMDIYEISEIGKSIRDFTWVYVLLSFSFWVVLKKNTGFKFWFHDKKLLIFIFIFMIYSLVQAVRTYPQIGMFGTVLAIRNTIEYIPLIFVTVTTVKTKEDVMKIMKWFTVLVFVVSTYGIIQFIFNIENRNFVILRPDYGYTETGVVVTSVFPDYNYLACFLIFLVFMILSIYNYLSPRIFIVSTLTLSSIVLLLTQSRMGLFTFMVCLFLLFMLKRKFNFASAMIVLASAMVLIFYSELSLSRIQTLGIKEDPRFVSWIYDIQNIIENPLFGYGLGMFGGTNLTLGKSLGGEIFGVDNFYLTTALNMGLLGLILFFIIIYHIFSFSLKLKRIVEDKFLRDMIFGINIGIFGILFFTIAFNQLEAFPINLYFWFLVGLIYVIANLNYTAGNPRDARTCSNAG